MICHEDWKTLWHDSLFNISEISFVKILFFTDNSSVICFKISCKIVDSDWLRDIWLKLILPAESWNHVLTRDGTWQPVILLDDRWYSKNYRLRRIYARTVHHRFWLASYERLNIRSTKYKHKYSLDLDCFKPNVM